MNELPKELTPELLSLVLDYKITNVSLVRNNHINVTGNTEKYAPNTVSINLDTLGRLMKEWCLKQGYLPAVTFNEDLTIWMVLHNTNGNECYSKDYNDTVEFEAVLKATHWVAKEKGLL